MKSNKTTALSEMDESLKKIAEKIESEDFSQGSHREEVRINILKNIREKEVDTMKKTRPFKKPAMAVASIILATTLFAQTALAKEITHKIIETFSVGNGRITITQDEPREKQESQALPEALKGKLFDEKGKEIKAFTEDVKKLYTKDGQEITYIGDNNSIITQAQYEAERTETCLILKEINERNKYTCFDVKVPKYLPEGYTFERIELYKDEEGKVEQSKYIDIYYTNETTGEFIFMQQRFADEETGYATGTDGTVEKVKVNGVEALIMDDRSIDWEANGVLYHLSSRGAFGKEELMKIAESIK